MTKLFEKIPGRLPYGFRKNGQGRSNRKEMMRCDNRWRYTYQGRMIRQQQAMTITTEIEWATGTGSRMFVFVPGSGAILLMMVLFART
jgi:hypothetical protein